MKPDWKDAPAGANWLAMDKSGDWYWFECKPEYSRGIWMSEDGANQLASAAPECEETLEPRP